MNDAVRPSAKRARRRSGEDATPRPARQDLRIDELARRAGTTVRNVRAYQDRGLLPPPERRGRVGIYGKAHLGRLRLIAQLLGRGYTLSNIQELFEAVEKGYDVRQIVGLEHAISSPWSDEPPTSYSMVELLQMFEVGVTPTILAKILALGLLEPDGTGYRAPNPKILKAGAGLVRAGLPLAHLLTLLEQLRSNVERVADEMVQLVVKLLDRYGEGQLPPRDEIPGLADLIWRLRPLANMAIDAEVSRALEKSANKFLGERVAQILEHLHDPPGH